MLVKNKKMSIIIKGIVISLIITLISLLLFAVILTCTQLQEKCVNIVIIIINSISIFTATLICTLKIRKGGLIKGIFISLIYILIIYFISSIIDKDFSFNIYTLIILLTSVLSGSFGGIIGVNIN